MTPATLLRFPVAISGMKRAEVLLRALESGLFLETNYERLLPGEISGNELANASSSCGRAPCLAKKPPGGG
jgi:hypothetical protein